MSPETKLFLAAGAAVAVPFLAGLALEDPQQKRLAKDLTTIGLIGTIVGVPIGLYTVPRMSTIGAATVLTIAGLGLKYLLLDHDEPDASRAFVLAEAAV